MRLSIRASNTCPASRTASAIARLLRQLPPSQSSTLNPGGREPTLGPFVSNILLTNGAGLDRGRGALLDDGELHRLVEADLLVGGVRKDLGAVGGDGFLDRHVASFSVRTGTSDARGPGGRSPPPGACPINSGGIVAIVGSKRWSSQRTATMFSGERLAGADSRSSAPKRGCRRAAAAPGSRSAISPVSADKRSSWYPDSTTRGVTP